MHKTISIELSSRGLEKAIRQLEEFQKDFLRRVELLRQRVAEEVSDRAQALFDKSDVDRSWIAGEPASNQSRKASVSVSVEQKSDGISVVVARGEDAVWVEFGTGVHYNGSAGSSPNPWGAENGLTIGSYGQKNGQYDVWRYYEDGEKRSTHGVPATMPMYNSAMAVVRDIERIAKEVFA